MRRLALLGALVACGSPQHAPPEAPELKLTVPSTLEVRRPREGEARTVHVRVWADAAVRATPRWKDEINDQVDYATQFLTPLLGVRLQVDSIADWSRAGDFHGALASLAAADPGKDAAWVIGFVAAPDAVTTVMADLGDAAPLGHHVVLRAWAEKPETDLLAAKLPDVKDAQRGEYLAAHRRHKEAVILLHELAVTLGAIAETDPTWIQHDRYGIKMHTFSDRDRELMQLALDMRIADTSDDKIAGALVDGIEKSDWGGWIPASHDEVLARLRGTADSTKAGRTAAAVPFAAAEQLDRIRQLRAANPAQALAELDTMLTAYPGNAAMHQLKCELLLVKPGAKDPAARAACARVSELAPGDPTVHLAVGEALLAAGDAPGARAELALAADRIPNLDKGVPDAWRRLLADYHDHGYLTWTEDVIAQGKLAADAAAVPIAAEIAQLRARDGVPRGAKGVKPEDEPALVTAVKDARTAINASKRGDAERILGAAERRWPNAPGLLAERCELALRGGDVGGARAACERAVAADPDASWALYLSGVIALKDTSAAGARVGIERLKRAIAVDPDLGPAWRALGKAYDRIGAKAELATLGAAYAAKFNQPLPP